jgi:hypothetical protein
MKYKMPNKCPVCGNRLTVTRLCCYKCSTVIEGSFRPCEFCNLPSEDLEFIKIFIKCRGSIKEVEKELGISYPKFIVYLGDTVVQSIFDSKEAHVKDLRGKWHTIMGYPSIVSYHPLAVGRRPNLIKHFIEDWRMLSLRFVNENTT